jgi:pimeloyl-ACP methyl ester carboxylesterase
MRKEAISTIIFYLLTLNLSLAQEYARTDTFKFVFERKMRVGVIDYPIDKKPKSLVIFVPGDGKTILDFGLPKDLRSHFVQMDLSCCVWDKPGCGKSEGVYDDRRTVQNEALEFITAIEELKRQKAAGSNNIGLWRISRGGWIAPLIMEKEKSIAFWISVSGVDGEDNNTYLLEKNLLIQGMREDSVKLLISEYRTGNRLFWQGSSYEDYIGATKNLYENTLFKKLHGDRYSKDEYIKDQAEAMKKYRFDNETASIIIVPDFSEILKKIHCPVLTIFGEKDSQVDWQRTLALYKNTIGANPDSKLTVKTFPNCGHPMLKSKTCGIDYEDLKLYNFQPCDGYYEAISQWLEQHGFIKQSMHG